MLNRWKIFLAYHQRAARQSLTDLRGKPLATLMTAIVIAVSLALPTLFYLIANNANQVTINWQKGGHISLYLKPHLTEVEQQKALEKIKLIQGVGQADLKSAAQGLSELEQQEGMQDIRRYLPENPLPAVIEITPAPIVSTAVQLDLLVQELQTLSQVDQAKVDMKWIKRLDAILGFVGKFAQALLILLALAVVLIIATTLRLMVQRRQEEIQVLKLIGAKEPFILRPFLYAGIWYGAIGAVFTVLLVNLFILSLGSALNQLMSAYQMHYPLVLLSIRQILLLILFAIILGWLGARFSVKRQLAAIEPQL